MRLAILDADVLREELRPRYHSYGQMFVELIQRRGLDWRAEVFTVIRGEYPDSPEPYGAFLITGSQYDAFSDEPWVVRLREYVRDLYRRGRPLVGICFGHQLLAQALGGEAGRNRAGWGLGVMRYALEETPPFVDGGDSVPLIVSHRDQVLALPPGSRRLLSNDFCPNAGFYQSERLLAFQGHPEFSADYARALMHYRRGQAPEAVLARAEASLDQPHQGDRVAGWIGRFVEQAVQARMC